MLMTDVDIYKGVDNYELLILQSLDDLFEPPARVTAHEERTTVSRSLTLVTEEDLSEGSNQEHGSNSPKITLLPSFHICVTIVSPGNTTPANLDKVRLVPFNSSGDSYGDPPNPDVFVVAEGLENVSAGISHCAQSMEDRMVIASIFCSCRIDLYRA